MYMMLSSVHLMENAVQPSEAPDVHDGICSTPSGKYSTPSETPDLRQDMQYTQVELLKYSMASAVHFMVIIVHPSVVLDVR